MKSGRLRTLSIATVFAFSATTLTGCSLDVGSLLEGDVTGIVGEVASQFGGTDVMFAQMMIEHHQQAIEMGQLAATRASSPEVKALAAEIVAEQTPEINQLKTWLGDAGASLKAGHEMAMSGMLSGAQMTALTAAAGETFDQLFLKGMIAHHKGAIVMAKMVVNSENPDAAALGKAIIASQTKQIERMEALLAQ